VEQLAPFVDGTLESSERAAVERHLRMCAGCRDDVRAATAARDALRAMPTPEAPDLVSHFSPERVAGLSRSGRAAASPWTKVAPALAVAAVVALVAIVVPRLGTSSDDAQTAADAAAGAAVTGGAVRLELDDATYDVDALDDAVDEFAASLDAGGAGATATESGSSEAAPEEGPASAPPATDQARFAGPDRAARAADCLRQAFPGFPGELVRMSRASFDGRSAFLGYVLESPGAGAAPDTVSIWVAATAGCTALSITSARL
jgi:hypothetical protein